jgi:two-component system NtrC family response regulator
MIRRVVEKQGCAVDTEPTLIGGLHAAREAAYDVVFLDVRMPDGNGLDFIPRLRATASCPEVIIMTGFGNEDGAEIAIKSGAWDYVQKTGSPSEILLPLSRALQYRHGLRNGATGPRVALQRNGIVGESRALQACLDLLAQAAGSEANALITGETGTGKELFARALHANSPRSGERFVTVDCAALPEHLAESALFGHSKGAFTGADRRREGLIRQAHRGTLFLDEVGELTTSLQKTLLRTLQERRFRPVGSSRETKSDFRLVAATNRDLDAMAAEGLFREDLLYRLRTFQIELPPLRARRDDIRQLTLHHLSRQSEREGAEIKGISPEFLQALLEHPWPGNVRELLSCLEVALRSAGGSPTLYRVHLPIQLRISAIQRSLATGRAGSPSPHAASSTDHQTLRTVLEEAEKAYLTHLFERTGGDVRETCRISGLSRTALYTRLKKHGIHRDPRSS